MGLVASKVTRHILRRRVSLRPPVPDGPRLHVGAGQVALEGYENLDAYDQRRLDERCVSQGVS